MSIFYKKCSKCKEIKTIDQYNKNKTKTYGVDSDCKESVLKRKSQTNKKTTNKINVEKFLKFVDNFTKIVLYYKEKENVSRLIQVLQANTFIEKYGKDNIIDFMLNNPFLTHYLYFKTFIDLFLEAKLSEFGVDINELNKEHFNSCYSLFHHFHSIYPNNNKRALLYTLKAIDHTIYKANDYAKESKAYGRHRVNYNKNFIKNISKRYIDEGWHAPFIEGFDDILKNRYNINIDGLWYKKIPNIKNKFKYDIIINNQTINNFIDIVR
jgi:hypothetical protein